MPVEQNDYEIRMDSKSSTEQTLITPNTSDKDWREGRVGKGCIGLGRRGRKMHAILSWLPHEAEGAMASQLRMLVETTTLEMICTGVEHSTGLINVALYQQRKGASSSKHLIQILFQS